MQKIVSRFTKPKDNKKSDLEKIKRLVTLLDSSKRHINGRRANVFVPVEAGKLKFINNKYRC